MFGALWPQADAGAVPEPQPASFGLFMGDLQPLPPPDLSTRLSLTDQPAWRSRAAIFR